MKERCIGYEPKYVYRDQRIGSKYNNPFLSLRDICCCSFVAPVFFKIVHSFYSILYLQLYKIKIVFYL